MVCTERIVGHTTHILLSGLELRLLICVCYICLSAKVCNKGRKEKVSAHGASSLEDLADNNSAKIEVSATLDGKEDLGNLIRDHGPMRRGKQAPSEKDVPKGYLRT
jgi:hypothetical protein